METNDSTNTLTGQGFRSFFAEKKKWITVKKITAIVVLIVGCIAAFEGIRNAFFYKSARLTVKADYVHFAAANDFERKKDGEELAISRHEIEKFLPTDKSSYAVSERILSYVQSNQPNVPLERLHTLATFMTFDLENTGGKEAQNVELSVPVNGYCKIIKAGDKPVFTQIENREIKLSNIQPSERVLIAVWGDKPTDDYGRSIGNPADMYLTRLNYNNDEVTEVTFPTKIRGFEATILNIFSVSFLLVVVGLAVGGFMWLAFRQITSVESETP